MKSITIFISILFSIQSYAQVDNNKANTDPLQLIKSAEWRLEAANTITAEDLKKHLSVLASDALEGRETGEKGNEMAAAYLSKMFENYGLTAVGDNQSYLQPIDMSSVRWEKIDLTVNGKEYRHLWDFFALHEGNEGGEELNIDELVFVGYGIEDGKINNYKNTDINGKTVLMYGGEPMDENGNSVITGNSTTSDWTNDPFKKIELAKAKGAKTVFIIADKFKQQIAQNRKFLIGPSVKLKPLETIKEVTERDFQYIVLSPELAKDMIGKKLKKVKKTRAKISNGKMTKGFKVKSDITGHMIKRSQSRTTANVIGVLPGKHPEKKKQHIIVTAHFDHLGKRGEDIFNGADDNGSGTSTVLELAEAFTTAAAFGHGPDRSIIFLLVSGEEKGLLGSKFYTDYPIIPLEDIMVDVNIDMVGRTDDKHVNPRYIYVIGADRMSTTLHDVNEDVNKRFENLELDYTYNAEDDPNRYYYRSDHYNFAIKGIPAIFFFNGTHADYHRPSDTIDKIQFDKMTSIGRHIFHLIWELGNREEAIEVNVR
jgi:hypothetical protein